MVQRAILNYYKFFDETIQSSTFIVLIITSLIFLVGIIIPVANAQSDFLKGSILEASHTPPESNIVMINGVAYKIYFEQVN